MNTGVINPSNLVVNLHTIYGILVEGPCLMNHLAAKQFNGINLVIKNFVVSIQP